MLTIYRFAFSLIVILYLVGCSSPIYWSRQTIRPLTVLQQSYYKNRQLCEGINNGIPNVADLQNFKYGCFCGQGHPSFTSNGLTTEELIAKYYSIEPKDDIDFICQKHDICWILSGERTIECNLGLINELHKLAMIFVDKPIVLSNPDFYSHYLRCYSLTKAIGNVFYFPGVGDKKKDLEDKIYTLSLSIPFGALNLVEAASYGFPGPYEKCFVNIY